MSESSRPEFQADIGKGIRNGAILILILGLLLLPFARSAVFLILSTTFLATGLAGIYYSMRHKLPRRSRAAMENLVLETAGRNRGVLSPAVLALEAKITVEEAIGQLESMAELGVCRKEINAQGGSEYYFPDFLPQS